MVRIVHLVRAVLLLLLGLGVCHASFSLPEPWKWRCVPHATADARCVKERLSAVSSGVMSHTACQLICGKYGSLWPIPKSVSLGDQLSYFLPGSIVKLFEAGEADTILLNGAFQKFLADLDRYNPDSVDGKAIWKTDITHGSKLAITISISGPSVPSLSLNAADEEYNLSVAVVNSAVTVKITAKTFFGARHGLETLSQLIDYENEKDCLQIVNRAEISDRPSFPYRGILLDTSRNYFSIKSIERTLDGMAANKLNTFHWHITDSHSFPLVMKSLPKMAYYGAYSSRQLYQAEDVRHIVQYGRVRGVRVLPEFDAPAHVGNGWEWGPEEGLGNLAVCVNMEPWQDYCVEPPCGQLNIANENIYPVLGRVYQEMLDMFGPLDLFHYGGDEVNLNCWNTTDEIVGWMRQHHGNLTADSYYGQWSKFQSRAQQLLTKANKGVEIPGILWTSHLTEKGRTDRYLEKEKYIIQIWSTGEDPLIKELLDKGYRVIFSNHDAWYLDCGFGAWVGAGNNWCSPYKGWQKVYDNSPRKISLNITGNTANLDLILGGEVALWTEQVDDTAIDSRIWPRAAALAERLWSDPEHGWEEAEYRMIHQRQRLVGRGLGAERLQPQWCQQNEGLCYLRGNELP